MGYALITGGGTDARYTVQLDFGEAARVANLAATTAALIQAEQKILQVQALIVEHDAREVAQIENLGILQEQIIQAINDTPPGLPPDIVGATKIYDLQLRRLWTLRAQSAPDRAILRTLQGVRLRLRKLDTQWETLPTVSTRQAWCADFTETASGFVATLDIPGESDLILIAPAGRAPVNATDGYLFARDLMSPEQCFFNAAILPGWQKFLPTYRWGTLTGINWDANTGDVSLADALSSAQRLPVNQADSLQAVAFDYMQTDARAFDPDSRVVVGFTGQDWNAPKIIGFLDNPRPDPPTFSTVATISAQSFTEDEPVSVALGSFWQWGAEPRSFAAIEGTIPAGLSIDSAGLLSGTPTTPATSYALTLRCSDVFYSEGTNRRYDDSNSFTVEVLAAAEFIDAALGLISFVAAGGNKEMTLLISMGDFPGVDSWNLSVIATGTGTKPTPQSHVFCTFVTDNPPLSLYYRVSVTGDTPSGTLGVWSAVGSSPSFQWSVGSFASNTASWTFELARDAAGSNIVCAVTGSIYVESF